MVKQYVGARYVPKFASPIEWAANTSYEALTVVNFNNASYTSKVPVPPTVGNPANNPLYWALTGNYNAQVEQYRQETENYNAQVEQYRQETENYNAQVEQYRQEISDIDSAVTTITDNLNKEISDRSALISKDSGGNTVVTSTNGALYINTKDPIKYKAPVTLNDDFNYIPMTDTNGNEYKVLVDRGNSSIGRKFNKYVIIGDSYADGYTPEKFITSWSDILPTKLGNTCYANIAVGGLGVNSTLTGDQNATNTVNKLTADNTVDSVIYCAGRNDANGASYEQITDGLESFVNACHAKFPKAIVYIGFIGWDSGITEYSQARSFYLEEAIAAYSNNTKNITYTYLANSELILHDNQLMASDGKHPNENGQITLANGIYSCLNGGTYGFHKTTASELTAVDNQTIYLREIFDHGDDLLDIYTNYRIAVNASLSTEASGNSVKLCDNFQLRYMIPSGYGFTKIPATFDIQYNDSYYALVPGFLKIQNTDGQSNKLYAEFFMAGAAP